MDGPEFLIRTSEEDFRLKKISGITAASFFRPCRVSPNNYEIKETQEGGANKCLIKNISTGRIVSLSDKAFNLWEQMDGKTTLRALTAGYFLKYGTISFDEIRGLVRQLHNNGLIETRLPSLVRVHRLLEHSRSPIIRFISKAANLWAGIGFDIKDVDTKIDSLNRKIGFFLFNRYLIIGLSAVGGIATFVFARSLVCSEYNVSSFLDSPWKWAVAYLILVVHIPSHELAHALSAKHFGYRVRAFGFGLLHNIFPVFYADVTDIWLAPCGQRIIVALAGIFSDWILGAIAISISFVFPACKYFMYLIAFNCYITVLINLYPFFFLELDGYYILIDLLKLPHLRNQAVSLFKNIFRGRLTGLICRENLFPFLYGIISFVSIGLILWFTVRN